MGLRSIVKMFVLIGSGIAIVVVGGFMMGAVARLWSPKEKQNKEDFSRDDIHKLKKPDR